MKAHLYLTGPEASTIRTTLLSEFLKRLNVLSAMSNISLAERRQRLLDKGIPVYMADVFG